MQSMMGDNSRLDNSFYKPNMQHAGNIVNYSIKTNFPFDQAIDYKLQNKSSGYYKSQIMLKCQYAPCL